MWVRNPAARRPWQHVLEPLSGYLRLARALSDGPTGDSYNFGPEPGDVHDVRTLVEIALATWPGAWRDISDPDAPHEAGLLSLGIERARSDLGYAPRWDFATGLGYTLAWYREVAEGADPLALTRAQIANFGTP